jgi:hypothetical protein
MLGLGSNHIDASDMKLWPFEVYITLLVDNGSFQTCLYRVTSIGYPWTCPCK